MLGRYFYHQIFRKSIIGFCSVFNNITIKRKVPGVKEQSTLESYKVPIAYGPYMKYLAMIAAEATPQRQGVQITLPRMSCEIKGLSYDGSRKVAPTTFMKSVPEEGAVENAKPVQYKQYMPVPYNIDMELAIISKNQDDGLQILEQILPYFHPSLNISIEIIDETHEERDIAIVLNDVGYVDDYEGDYSQRRTLIWTLRFTVKTYLFGPIDVEKDIRKVTIDYRSDIARRPAELRYNAEIESTDEPPIPRDEINPVTDNYRVVETYEDVFGDDQGFFGLE